MYNSNNFLLYISFVFIINTVIMGLYFLGFWSYKGATPGKMIKRLKIVDAITFQQPTNKQLIKRFFGYITVLFGIWCILFSKQNQALHDKTAGTIVIKS